MMKMLYIFAAHMVATSNMWLNTRSVDTTNEELNLLFYVSLNNLNIK